MKLRRRQSAALIIALIIVTISSMMILGVGKATISSTFVSNRFSDSVIADNLAWSGVENALFTFKTTPALGANVPTTLTELSNQNLVKRHNVSDSTDMTASSIDYTRHILDSAPAGWSLADQYYDLRMSGVDDILLGIDSGHEIKGVNISTGFVDQIAKKGGYFQVKSNEATAASPAYRLFDLSEYAGNNVTTDDSLQKIKFVYDIGTALSGTDTIAVNFYVKYRSDDADGDEINDNLACKTSAVGYHNDFYRSQYVLSSATPAQGSMDVFIPWPCNPPGNTLDTVVDYLAVEFIFTGGDKINFGLRLASHATGAPPLYFPNTGSQLGTGVTYLSSTGIYGNAKKTVELAVAKSLKIDPTSTTTSSPLCKGANDGSTNLASCELKVYRESKY